MEESISLMIYLEQITEDCCDHFERQEVGEEVFRNKANGNDEIEEDARRDRPSS